VLGAALLLALDHDLDGDRGSRRERADRGGVRHDPALVVGGSAPVHTAVSDGRLEGRGVPFVERALRLDVVVGVEQDGRRPIRTAQLAEHRGVPPRKLEEPHAAQAGVGQHILGGLRRGSDDRGVVPRIAHGGDPHQPLQLCDGSRHAVGDHVGKR
jgi:hypothetical protein